MTAKSTANGSTKKPSLFAAAEVSRAQSSDRLISAMRSAAGTASSGGSTRACSPRTRRHTTAPRRRGERRVQRHQPPERTCLAEADEEPLARVEVEGETERRERDHDERHRRREADEAGGEGRERDGAEHEQDAPVGDASRSNRLGANVRERNASATAIATRPHATTARERPSRHPSAPTAPMIAATSVPDTWGNVPRKIGRTVGQPRL